MKLKSIDRFRIVACLFREAWMHKEMAEYYEEKGLDALAVSELAEGYALMSLREIFRDKILQAPESLTKKENGKAKR